MVKDKKVMKCGFCKKEIERFKDFIKVKAGRKTIIICPYCNSILGIYALNSP